MSEEGFPVSTYTSFEIDENEKTTCKNDKKNEQDDDENARPWLDALEWTVIGARLEPDGIVGSDIFDNALHTDVQLQIFDRSNIGNVGFDENCFLCSWRIITFVRVYEKGDESTK